MTIHRRVTLQQIAQVAGVHHTTVSMALRNKASLPLDTRKRIQEIARRMGYRPDPALRALRMYQKQSKSGRQGFGLAYVTAFRTPDYWKTMAAFWRVHQGIAKRAEELGYRLEDFWFDQSTMSGDRASQILYARNITGLLIAPLPDPCTLNLKWERFASVSLTYSLRDVPTHVVSNNHLETVRIAHNRLLELGYKRIGLAVGKDSDERVSCHWSAGYLGEQSRLPLRQRMAPFVPEDFTQSKFTEWVKKSRPDAILSIYPHLNIIAWLRGIGLRVPEDVAFANLDAADPQTHTSGIDQMQEEIGRTAVDFLSGMVERNDLGLPKHPIMLHTQSRWVDGMTTRNP